MTVLTIEAAAILANTTPRQIKRLVCRRVLATVEVGDRLLILQEDFLAWLAAGGMQTVETANRAEERRRAAYRVKRARQAVNP